MFSHDGKVELTSLGLFYNNIYPIHEASPSGPNHLVTDTTSPCHIRSQNCNIFEGHRHLHDNIDFLLRVVNFIFPASHSFPFLLVIAPWVWYISWSLSETLNASLSCPRDEHALKLGPSDSPPGICVFRGMAQRQNG
jgi:hypothetical protein